MPKKFSFKKGKRMIKKKKYHRKKQTLDTVGTIARYAVKGFKFIKGLINVEKFKYDFGLGVTTITNTASISSLVGIATGDGSAARTGNSILVKYLYLNYIVNRDVASTTSADTFRIVIVQDREQVSDTAPGWTDVFSSASVVSPLNVNNVGRFTILYDKRQYVSSNSPQRSENTTIPLDFHIRYNGVNSTDIEKNGIWIMWLADSIANHVSILGNSRLAYYDN